MSDVIYLMDEKFHNSLDSMIKGWASILPLGFNEEQKEYYYKDRIMRGENIYFVDNLKIIAKGQILSATNFVNKDSWVKENNRSELVRKIDIKKDYCKLVEIIKVERTAKKNVDLCIRPNYGFNKWKEHGWVITHDINKMIYRHVNND